MRRSSLGPAAGGTPEPAARRLARWCEARPALALGVLGLACLATFLATIPLPRADEQLLSGDGVGYYAYLPSVVLNHDLDFTNQYSALLPAGHALSNRTTATGLPDNFWPVGSAVLWLPFFLLAHALALLLSAAGVGIRLDGCGYWHQAFVLAGNILYGCAALLLAFDAARRLARSASALWAVALVAFAGNLAYYITAEPSMPHAASAFAVSLFFSVWLRTRGRSGIRRAVLLGSIAGLVAAVRAQDLLLIAVPLAAAELEAFKAARAQRGAGALATASRDGGAMTLAALLAYSPQLVASQVLYGGWWRPPQIFAGWPGVPLFTWWSPHFWDVFFSSARGLFTWHPIYLVALLGVAPLWRRDRTVAAALLVGITAQAYVLGGWYDWSQGGAFGARSFVGSLPLIASALAALMDVGRQAIAARARALRWAPACVGAVLLAANFLLAVEYRFDLATRNRAATWNDLGARRVTFLLDRLVGPEP